MATFRMSIGLGNEAMQTPADIAEALRGLADCMERHTAGDPYAPIVMGASTRIAGNVIDGNGNRVGEWKVAR